MTLQPNGAGRMTTADLERLGERIANLTARFDDYGRQLAELVRKDVYVAEQKAILADLSRLQAKTDELEREAEQREADRVKERGEWRRRMMGTVVACVSTVLATVLGEILIKVLLK